MSVKKEVKKEEKLSGRSPFSHLVVDGDLAAAALYLSTPI